MDRAVKMVSQELKALPVHLVNLVLLVILENLL